MFVNPGCSLAAGDASQEPSPWAAGVGLPARRESDFAIRFGTRAVSLCLVLVGSKRGCHSHRRYPHFQAVSRLCP